MSLEILKTTFEHVAERIKDPFLGMYSFFVVVINWKIWIYLFSKVEIDTKIDEISKLIKVNHYQSIWKPLIFAFIFLICSSIVKTLFRLIVQLFQRFDDWAVRLPMDLEKIKLISENTRLSMEIDSLMIKNQELMRLNTYIASFLSSSTMLRSAISTRGNEVVSMVSGFQNIDVNSKDSVVRLIDQSIELTNRVEEFRVNLENLKRNQ